MKQKIINQLLKKYPNAIIEYCIYFGDGYEIQFYMDQQQKNNDILYCITYKNGIFKNLTKDF